MTCALRVRFVTLARHQFLASSRLRTDNQGDPRISRHSFAGCLGPAGPGRSIKPYGASTSERRATMADVKVENQRADYQRTQPGREPSQALSRRGEGDAWLNPFSLMRRLSEEMDR